MPSSLSSNPPGGQGFYFKDPRLGMTLAGRFLVRIAGGMSYLLLTALTFAFLYADIPAFRGLGVLLVLFLADRLLHIHEADLHLDEIGSEERVNVARYLNPTAYGALERAYDRSILKKSDPHLELAFQLIRRAEIRAALRRLDVREAEFKSKLEELRVEFRAERAVAHPERLAALADCARLALQEALDKKERFVRPADLFAALPRMEHAPVQRLFSAFSLSPRDVSQAMVFEAAARQISYLRFRPRTLGAMVAGRPRGVRHRIMNRAWTSRPTPALDAVSEDLTDAARDREIGFLIGHRVEYDHLLNVLARSEEPNVLIVGEPGVGKDTLVEHLAAQIVNDEVPPALFDKRLVKLHLSQLVAGAAPEELHARIQAVAAEILRAGNIIIYIPEIHNLVRTSGVAYLSAADALLPLIKSDAFSVIGSTHPREYRELLEPRGDFAGRFEVIRVEEVSEQEAERILIYAALLLERAAGVVTSFGAVKSAVALARRYFRDTLLPASAEELLKTAVTAAARKGERWLGPEGVIAVAEERVNVPLHETTAAEAARLLALEETIHRELVGQEEAVRAVADALRQYRSGLARKGGPIASFLFVGPTGVGKTELSKILARLEFGSEEAMVRFDMTEYQDKQSFFRLIGSPDGTVSGALTEAITKKPYSLVLLDEFEKASPDILDLFLQVLDDGRLTDNLGRTVDFTNTIVIATSNAHSALVNDALRAGQGVEQIADYLKAKLVEVFKPELLNRFTRVVVFRDLSSDQVREIAAGNLKSFIRTILEEQGIALVFESSAVALIAKRGFEPAFGARPLRRAIDELVRSRLAELILKGEVKRGDRVRVVAEGESLAFIQE